MYSALQRLDIAREVARAGGNVLKAQNYLREQYETMREIGENTIRRLLQEDGFAELIAAEGEKLALARAEGAALAERERARRDAEGTMRARLRQDNELLDDARAQLVQHIKGLDTDQAIKAYGLLQRIHDAREKDVIPAIAETREATLLIDVLLECCIAECGEARARKIFGAAKIKYAEKRQQAEEESGTGLGAQASGTGLGAQASGTAEAVA